MPNYVVRVVYSYPVDAKDAEDAQSTVPLATRMRYANAEGLDEITNESGEIVLKAQLVTDEGLLRLSKLAIEQRKGEEHEGLGVSGEDRRVSA